MSETYGREELVAEIGSAYLAALTGIDSSAIIQNQAAYLRTGRRRSRPTPIS